MEAVAAFYDAHPFWGWLALAAAILAVEVLSGSGWLLWASAAAALTGVAGVSLPLGFPAEVLIFAVLTSVSTLLARRYLPRRTAAEGGDINDNVARLLGRRGTAVQPFERGAGRVLVDGKEWAASLADGQTLEAGAQVEVVGLEGARLKVRGL